MKKIYFFAIAILATLSVTAQKDTLLYEGFETKNGVNVFDDMLTVPTGKDLKWVNWDKDGKAPGEGSNQSWYRADEIFQAQVTKPAIRNQTAHSLSWLKGEALGSNNILITPPISIIDENATLSWKSCPLQGPDFMDGYKVLVTVTSNDVSKAKPDTVYVAAEVTSYLSPATLNVKDYKFSKGYIHANGYTLKQYWDTTGVSIFYRGKLEPHTVSLSKYKGKKIYVHIMHDSGDDYIFEVDDILVKGNKTVGTKDVFASKVRLVTYPNPVVNLMNVLYRVENQADVTIDVTDIQGRVVQKLYNAKGIAGEMSHDFDVSQLTNGTYFLNLKIGDKVVTEQFAKF